MFINELKNSIKKNFDDRISSPFYGAFIISWLLWNWKTWYITFFIDSNLIIQKSGFLKIDYILNFYKQDFLSYGKLIIFPLISSYIIIYWLPKITNKFFDKSLENKNAIERIKIKREKELWGEKTDKLRVKEQVIEKEAEIKEKETKAKKTQEEEWDEEYNKFKNSSYFKLFSFLKTSIYNHGGRTWIFSGMTRQDVIPADLKAYLDANKIIEISSDKSGYEKANLTEKGKYFMKKYTEEN